LQLDRKRATFAVFECKKLVDPSWKAKLLHQLLGLLQLLGILGDKEKLPAIFKSEGKFGLFLFILAEVNFLHHSEGDMQDVVVMDAVLVDLKHIGCHYDLLISYDQLYLAPLLSVLVFALQALGKIQEGELKHVQFMLGEV